MDSSVENLTALAFPVLRMERLAGVMPIFSASAAEDIFRLASITSTFTIIDISFYFFNKANLHQNSRYSKKIFTIFDNYAINEATRNRHSLLEIRRLLCKFVIQKDHT